MHDYELCVISIYGYDLKTINISIRSFTVYPEGGKKSCRGKNPNAAVAQSPIGVILLSESFYVKQVLQKVDGSAIAMERVGRRSLGITSMPVLPLRVLVAASHAHLAGRLHRSVSAYEHAMSVHVLV